MKIEHGWLLRDDTLAWRVGGVAIDPATRTRREEYHWVMQRLASAGSSGQDILDAAAGYVPTWHELPRMMAYSGLNVVAYDMDERSILMPRVTGVLRMLGNITRLPFADASFDTTLCISVLEHLTLQDAELAVNEMLRVSRRSILLTADHGNWLPCLLGHDAGSAIPLKPALSPPVYWMEVTL